MSILEEVSEALRELEQKKLKADIKTKVAAVDLSQFVQKGKEQGLKDALCSMVDSVPIIQ